MFIMYKKSKILLILLLFCQSVYSQNKCPCEYGTTIKIKGKTSLIDSLGNYLIKSTDYIYIDFNESLAVVHFQSENKEFEKINSRLLEQETASKVIKVIPDVLSAVIDCNGRFVIRPTDKYFIRGNFNHGYAMIEQDCFYHDMKRLTCKKGFINTKGEAFFAGTPEYDYAYKYFWGCSDKFLFDSLQKQINIGRDSSNRVILYSIDKGSSVYRFTYSKSKQIGVMNRKGEVLIEPTSLQLNRFTNGVSVFSVDTVINEKRTYLLGLIDTNGVIRIQPLYKRLTPVNGEITIFYDGERSVYGLINKNGQIVYETSETIVDYTDNLIVIEYEITNEKGKKIEKLGLIDTDGHTIVRPKFEDIYHFENGLAKVELKNGKVGYINHKGEYVIRPKREE